MTRENNYFDIDEEDVLHDAFLMIADGGTDYDCLEDVIRGETAFDERALNVHRDWKTNE